MKQVLEAGHCFRIGICQVLQGQTGRRVSEIIHEWFRTSKEDMHDWCENYGHACHLAYVWGGVYATGLDDYHVFVTCSNPDQAMHFKLRWYGPDA